MHHGENVKEIEDPISIAKNRQRGLVLFGVYSFIYAAYVLTNTFQHQWMEETWVLGLNNAIVSGFGLILSAILIAFVYGFLCRPAGPKKEA